MNKNTPLPEAAVRRHYSVRYCIFASLGFVFLFCMLLAMFHLLQLQSKIGYENTYLWSLFSSIRNKSSGDIIQIFLALETGVAAIAIALLTIKTKSWGSLKFSTLQDMQIEAEKQDNLFGIMWILSLTSSIVAALSIATAIIKRFSPIDCLFTFLIASMALIVAVLPSLLRYEGVGHVRVYSRSLSTLINATNFADSIGLKIRRAPHKNGEAENSLPQTLRSLFANPTLRFHSLFAAPTLVLTITIVVTYYLSAEFSINALAVIYVALICIMSLWIAIHNTIKYSASKDKQYITFPFLALLSFFALASTIICLQYHWLPPKIEGTPRTTLTLLSLISNVFIVLLTIAISVTFIRKRESLWKFRIIKLKYASEVTSLLTYTKSIRSSLTKIPEEIRPTSKPLHKWIEHELKTSPRLKKALQSKKEWLLGENKSSSSQLHTKKVDEESKSSSGETIANVVNIYVFARSRKSMLSTRQRQQGRVRRIQRRRK